MDGQHACPRNRSPSFENVHVLEKSDKELAAEGGKSGSCSITEDRKKMLKKK
jgi:hypothetical protein